MPRVFYDGSCGLCAREIAHYRKIAPPGVFDWVDITTAPRPFTDLGFELADGLRALHVQDDDGTLRIGVDAFIAIWRRLDRWRWLARLVALPPLRRLAGWAYRRFADWRFRRLGYCEPADASAGERR